MAKHVLDLYELFNKVVEKGGLVEVINKKQWQEIIRELRLPSSITSAAFTLRTQYTRYLVYWVRRVKAAEVMEEGRPSPLMISCHCFLLMTSTSPPLATTRLNSSYRSKTCLAMMGRRLIGVPIKIYGLAKRIN